MDLIKRLDHALDYIEEHLTEKVDYATLANIACCSQHQFQKNFSFLIGVPLSEYIRRRRITLAAFELQNSDCKVVDVALKYGYESPEAFARAFLSIHGVSPTAARAAGTALSAYPRLSLQITVQGVTRMDYQIVNREAFTVYGIERMFDMTNDQNLTDIPKFWQECLQNGEIDKLALSLGAQNGGDSDGGRCPVGAICSYGKIDGPRFPYMLCVEKALGSNPAGYTEAVVPASTWAVFRSEPYDDGDGSVTIACQNLYKRIYREWFPTASYVEQPGYEMEIYYWSKTSKPYMEVWNRVQPK